MAEDYDKLLRDAQAPWQKDGFGVRGPIERLGPSDLTGTEVRAPYLDPNRITVRPFVPDPNVPSLSPIVQPTASSGPSTIYSFMMEDATHTTLKQANGQPFPPGGKILIHDGDVSTNGNDPQTPPGMGNDNFILPIANNFDSVWLEITYDTTTLAITSLNIAEGPEIPTSSLGDAYILLGTVSYKQDANGNVLFDSKGFPVGIDPQNAQCGDINIDLIYGAFNGQPAIYLLSQMDAPQLVV